MSVLDSKIINKNKITDQIIDFRLDFRFVC